MVGEELTESGGGVFLHSGDDVLVGRHGERRVGVVPESFGDDLDRYPVALADSVAAGPDRLPTVGVDHPRTPKVVLGRTARGTGWKGAVVCSERLGVGR